jgi:hypothetical protein
LRINLIRGKTPYPALPHLERSVEKLLPGGENKKGGKKLQNSIIRW